MPSTDLERLCQTVAKMRVDLDALALTVATAAAHDMVMEERVSTLIKFVDRLATVVYTSAGGLFITIVGSAILTRGV